MNPMLPIVFGHLVADYLLQSKEMAVRKSTSASLAGKKFSEWWLLLHCLIYTMCVTAMVLLKCHHLTPGFVVLIFLSHYPLDRWSVAHWCLKAIKGRDVEKAFSGEVPDPFAPFTYAIADNTLHLLLLYLFYPYVW